MIARQTITRRLESGGPVVDERSTEELFALPLGMAVNNWSSYYSEDLRVRQVAYLNELHAEVHG